MRGVTRYLSRQFDRRFVFAIVLTAHLHIDNEGRRDVYLKRPSQFSFEKIDEGADLKLRDVIFVGPQSSAVLDFDDPRIPSIRIHENSIIVFLPSEQKKQPTIDLRVEKGAATLVARPKIRQMYRKKAAADTEGKMKIDLEIQSELEKELASEDKTAPAPQVFISSDETQKPEKKKDIVKVPAGTVFQILSGNVTEIEEKRPPTTAQTKDKPVEEFVSVSDTPYRPYFKLMPSAAVVAQAQELTPEQRLLKNAGISLLNDQPQAPAPAPPPPRPAPAPVPTPKITARKSEAPTPKIPEPPRKPAPVYQLPKLPPAPPEAVTATTNVKSNVPGVWTASMSLGSFLSLVQQSGSVGQLASYALPVDLDLNLQYSTKRWSSRLGLYDFFGSYKNDQGTSFSNQFPGASVDFYWYEVGLELDYFHRAAVIDNGVNLSWTPFSGVLAKLMWKRKFLFRQLSQGGGGIWLLDMQAGISYPFAVNVAGHTGVKGFGVEGGLQGWAPKLSLFSDSVQFRFGPAVYLTYLKFLDGSVFNASHSEMKIMASFRLDF